MIKIVKEKLKVNKIRERKNDWIFIIFLEQNKSLDEECLSKVYGS